MKPTAFMPFYGNIFFAAIKPHPAYIGLGYLAAIWFYWHVNNGKPLCDDSESLRKICGIDPDDWPTARDIIFDNDKFFIMVTQGDKDMGWIQKRAEEEWKIAVGKYDKQVKKSKKGAEARWKSSAPPKRNHATGNATGIPRRITTGNA